MKSPACAAGKGGVSDRRTRHTAACAVGRFSRKTSHALAAQRTLCARADAAFPGNIGAKGSRREESRIFPKYRNAAEVHAELSETAHSGTGYPWISLHACSNRRKFLSPQTPRRPLTPPPLFAPNRSSKNIAEPVRLRSLRVRADAAFPSNIGAKGSRREESRIFPKTSRRRRSTCGTFGNCQFRYRLPTAIPAYLFQQAGVF